ncbi:glycerophosphodiester phosphodiesterase family protein [Solirubrobacter sp. CPCC 204708]|uniref:Glycerophosphodiester phosphodiesterase family protein n=1 Tax=Solirubrobacter deserti TaxID=2282478 RepID=A0ABT4RI55_9ACTN|nr:glycerophosphodiester phosphodiesterase family protein [Solirubrobacter deserti]MBE2318853.1 glycerophosphodiester phosphodiesterase family protein [Solirubrobacter deserti]MDA0138233.1 glycerophosphodiester phosphodiesterase family protein [Solirubrobacter deserti]
MKTRLALAVAATLFVAPAAQAQTTPPDDPRVVAMRAQIDALDDLVQRPACDQAAEPDRWLSVGTPDAGRARPLISAHRGALTLAPENTIQSYEYAFAFGVELVEVDIQQTKDGRFVALHDSTVDRTTNGTGDISTLTFDEVRALNAADYEPWKGGAYDPAQVASLEEVLALAKRVGGGLELDIKGSVTEEGKLTELVKEYGLIEQSIFNSGDIRVLQAAPNARIIYNRDRWEPPYLMYEIAKVAPVFGSRRDEYNAEAIAAIHDNCGLVMPHAYDAGEAHEVEEFRLARAMGADGVQTNQPEAIVAAAGIPAPSTIVRHDDEVCLVNRDNGLGFPGKTLIVDGVARTAGRGGCVAAPGARDITFAGTGAVTPSTATVTAITGGVGGSVGPALSLTLGPAPAFDPFVPGVEQDYTASTEATVLSTAGNATLSVSGPGHLTNGAFTLAQPLRVEISPNHWPGPVTAAKSTITFKQSIGAHDPLRTGTYSKTLTFTLSTTAP